MAINIDTYREILKHLDEIIAANQPTQPIPIFKSFEAMASADKNPVDGTITLSKAIMPPLTPKHMFFSAKKTTKTVTIVEAAVTGSVPDEAKPIEPILKKAAPRIVEQKKPTHNSEPFFDLVFNSNEFEPSDHESSHDEDSFDIFADHLLEDLNVVKTEHIEQKTAALDKIQPMRDHIQAEYNIIATLPSDKQRTAATYLRVPSELNQDQTADNFFKDLKDLKDLIKQIPLEIKAKKSDIQLFANNGLRLIAKLEKYSADYNEHLAKPVPVPFDLEPISTPLNAMPSDNADFDIEAKDSEKCYTEKCRPACRMM